MTRKSLLDLHRVKPRKEFFKKISNISNFILFACSHEDAPGLTARDVPAFLRHLLERVDFSRDLHFITRSTNDTLDYTGSALNEGSKLVWASAGKKRRELGCELSGTAADLPTLPDGFGPVRMTWCVAMTASLPPRVSPAVIF